jgi:uncharacterized protein YlxW (UPF0749 family)
MSGRQDPPKLPPQTTMGLLDYLTTHAMDEDYAFVSAQRAAAQRAAAPKDGEKARPARHIGLTGALMMAVFAVLVVTAAAQTSRNALGDEAERRDLAGQVAAAKKQLAADRASLTDLRRTTAALQSSQLSGDRTTRSLRNTIQRLGALSGTLPVRGPGVRVVADDAPDATSDRQRVLDTDLQRLVNGFWKAGAEAIAVNGQRLTNLSTIRVAGGAITVNARSLSRPYVVSVVGNKDTLPARFAETTSGQAWLDLQRQVGLQLTITPVSSLRLPATEVTLRYATTPSAGGAR